MAPPPNHDGYRAHADLRALMNQLLDAPDQAGHDEAMAAIRVWLRTHCASCGAVVGRSSNRPDVGDVPF